MNDNLSLFNLREIAGWQMNQNSKVFLPNIQRGFVWKPKQVEDLWDSLLRGFPVGSFLMSKNVDNYDLIDGQQRATAIFLGFYNPFDKSNTLNIWSLKKKNNTNVDSDNNINRIPVLWIDIDSENKYSNRKYLFRLVTAAHPWGYQSEKNNEKLSVSDRKNALEILSNNHHHNNKKNNYIQYNNTTYFPYDCVLPIPVCFLWNAQNACDVINSANKHLPYYLKTKNSNDSFDDKIGYINKLKENKEKIDNLISEFYKINNTKISCNVVKKEVMDDLANSNEEANEDPTLFVRLNSAGTPLSGDDLIYSIYKSIFPKSKEIIENISADFIQPKIVLSLVTRLAATFIDENKPQYLKKFSVRDFQNKLQDDKYKQKLEDVVKNSESDNGINSLFSAAIDILSLEENESFEGKIPPVMVKQFIKSNQDLFFMLLCWLKQNGTNVSEERQKKIVAKLFIFSWFKLEDFQRLWSEGLLDEDFWEKKLDSIFKWKPDDPKAKNLKGIPPLPSPDMLSTYYKSSTVFKTFYKAEENRWGVCTKYDAKVPGNEIVNFIKKHLGDELDYNYFYGWHFMHFIISRRELLLFAQREYINKEFESFNQFEDLDDTNTPWDWDHIYPNSWFHNKHCKQIIKDWGNSIGNLRALALSKNRGRGNSQAPSEIKEEEELNESFMLKDDWSKIESKIEAIIDKSKEQAYEDYFLAVTKRFVEIYRKFWDDLGVGELMG